MANIYTNHGFTNLEALGFNEDLNLDKYQTELCFPFIEYTSGNGAKVRLVGTGFIADFVGRVSLQFSKFVEEDSEKWIGTGQPKTTSTRNVFVNASGELVEASEALEDDTTREILDSEGNSFDPKQYKKKIVTGYNNEFDFFVKNFFKGSMIISDYVIQVLANQAGVALPA